MLLILGNLGNENRGREKGIAGLRECLLDVQKTQDDATCFVGGLQQKR